DVPNAPIHCGSGSSGTDWGYVVWTPSTDVTARRVRAFHSQHRFPQGSQVDFEQIFRRLYPSLFRYLHRLTGDPDAADDIAQESFARLLRRPMPEAEAKPWLFTVATNLVRDSARKSTRRERILERVRPTPSAPDAPDVVTERNERITLVRQALERLSERDRTLLLMRGEGFTYEEMARAVGVAPASVGTLLARALRRFSAVYRLHEVGDESHR